MILAQAWFWEPMFARSVMNDGQVFDNRSGDLSASQNGLVSVLDDF